MRGLGSLLVVVALVFGLGYYFTKVNPLLGMVKQGLDLQGGSHIVLEAKDDPNAPVTDDAMSAAVGVIRKRVDLLGVAEPVIQREGARRIIVELAGVKDPEEAIAILGKTAVLEFRDPQGNLVVTGKDLVDAREQITGQGGGYVVALRFSSDGAKKFADATARLVGQNIGIYLDGKPIQNPRVDSPIPSGEAQITGYPSLDAAREVAIILKSGALPVNLDIKENRTVSSTLGQDSIAKSKHAALIGIGAVALFMILAFPGPGLVADLALTVYVFLLLGAMVALNAVMTLPGIAGIVLSVGMAVDANILIFERIREELGAGKTIRAGIAAGFNRAFTTIFDSNSTVLIAAAVLFYFGTGPIRGFAVTLALGSLIHLFTAVTLTKFVLTQLVEANIAGRAFFGVRG